MDLKGDIIDPGTTQLGISKAGYVIHSAIHEARKDIRCIIHVHTSPGAAVSAMKCGLLRICQESMAVRLRVYIFLFIHPFLIPSTH